MYLAIVYMTNPTARTVRVPGINRHECPGRQSVSDMTDWSGKGWPPAIRSAAYKDSYITVSPTDNYLNYWLNVQYNTRGDGSFHTAGCMAKF